MKGLLRGHRSLFILPGGEASRVTLDSPQRGQLTPHFWLVARAEQSLLPSHANSREAPLKALGPDGRGQAPEFYRQAPSICPPHSREMSSQPLPA